jgi:arginine-tRNA-protein transferase
MKQVKVINNQIFFKKTPPHKCSYFPDRIATTVFADPFFPDKDNVLYDTLIKFGFRRSGEEIYRPHCEECYACTSVRVPVQFFKPRRSQRRVWKKNKELTVSAVVPVFKQEHFNLYSRYVASRHKGGSMDNPTPEDYMQFLTSSWAKTVFYEFRLQEQLVMLAVVDHADKGLSAVYTCFEPDFPARSLGVYAILWEIEETKRLNLNWLYLGYWIKGCQKMHYKTEYQPLECYQRNTGKTEWELMAK